jgi:hypothetical protein
VPSLSRPELHNGELLWVNRDVVDKITYGDPVIGWEGDDRLAVFLECRNPEIWAIYRLEDDNKWRHVVRTEPGIPFDERVLHWLCQHDTRKNDIDLDKLVKEANEKVEAERDAKIDEWENEEIFPRLKHAMRKDGDL